MQKIKILQSTVCGGEEVLPGEVVDASDSDARILIGSGKAEKYVPPKAPARRARRAPTNRQISAESLESR